MALCLAYNDSMVAMPDERMFERGLSGVVIAVYSVESVLDGFLSPSRYLIRGDNIPYQHSRAPIT